MRKIHIYVAMSLDGYLADINGGVSFLEGEGSDKDNEIIHDERIFTTEELASLLQRVKAECGKNIWIYGGASVINQVIELSLADIFTISIIPTILGNGIKLFDKIDFETKLKLKSTRTYNGIVDLEYELRNA